MEERIQNLPQARVIRLAEEVEYETGKGSRPTPSPETPWRMFLTAKRKSPLAARFIG